MITRERLKQSAYGRNLLRLYRRLTPYHVSDWGNNDSEDKEHNGPSTREQVTSVSMANVITSLHRDGSGRHALVLDIDHPAWLIPSTTPEHYHLYVDVPGGIEASEYWEVLTALANARVIESGYAGASAARGFTSVRLPWEQKEKGPTQHD